MKRNTMLAFVALLMVVIIGAGGAYWAIKKYRAQKNQEFLYEGKMGQAKEGFSIDVFEQQILSDDLLDQIIEEHQLVTVWGLADSAAAKEQIKQKFTIKLDGSEVKARYQDKDKVLAQKVLESIVKGYYLKLRGRQPASR